MWLCSSHFLTTFQKLAFTSIFSKHPTQLLSIAIIFLIKLYDSYDKKKVAQTSVEANAMNLISIDPNSGNRYVCVCVWLRPAYQAQVWEQVYVCVVETSLPGTSIGNRGVCVCERERERERESDWEQLTRHKHSMGSRHQSLLSTTINPAVSWVEYPAFWSCSSSACTKYGKEKSYKDFTSFYCKKLVELHFLVCKARACLAPLKSNIFVIFFFSKDKRPIQIS